MVRTVADIQTHIQTYCRTKLISIKKMFKTLLCINSELHHIMSTIMFMYYYLFWKWPHYLTILVSLSHQTVKYHMVTWWYFCPYVIRACCFVKWVVCQPGMVGLAPKWVRLAPNGTNRGFFRSDFSAFGAGAPNALKSDLKNPRICPIWGQSDPLWSQTYHPCFLIKSKSCRDVRAGYKFGQIGPKWD